MVQFKQLATSLLALATSVIAEDVQKPLSPVTTVTPPLLGFGTWNLLDSAENTSAVVSLAIQSGYRHIDGAAIYRNEPAVGKGIADGILKAGLKRDDIWITSKLWNSAHGSPAKVSAALDKTLSDLGVEYLDLYLVHWPVNGDNEEEYVETWKSLELLSATGKIRHIGVANFSPDQLKNLIKTAIIKPAVHQMELHPYLQQADWVEYHQKHGIHVTAYSPFGNTNPTYDKSISSSAEAPPLLLKNKELGKIAEARGVSIAQVALSWGLSRGTSVIPKSKHEKYIKENFDSSKVKLEDEDYKVIEKLGKDYLTRFSNPSKSWGVKLFQGLDAA